MRSIKQGNSIPVQEGTEVKINKRVVTVTGPKGTLTRSFAHAPIDLKVDDKKNLIVAEKWFGTKSQNSTLKSVLSHINNMMTGVTLGYKYKMRFAYAHFPVSVTVNDAEKQIEIRNFLGEKYVRRVPLVGETKASRTDVAVMKDELVLEGTSIRDVSLSASLVHGVTLVKRKDIRKFLDGIYVSAKENIEAPQ
eukprot:TRINITY_DN76_c0_g1_i1.p1 TRINITY_DN76_c0_g1~~TRINITY_DN76_c0_g1_i1.p1  ORF type:complete len:193 (+),score=40.87 TRINITY_DN76_c0_g1_i1:52-630(+)